MSNTESVPKSPTHVCPLLNGIRIPEVFLKDADGADFDLVAAIKKRPALLVFYRGGW
jgi:hypothetical protein